MADLALRPSGPFDGLGLPYSAGACTLSDATPEAAYSLMPFRDRTDAVAQTLGVALPPPNRSTGHAAGRVLWSGLDSWLLLYEVETVEGAALVDLSDSLAGLLITGAAASDVLARLCPLDTHPDRFPPGASTRSEVAHIAAQITCMDDGFEILAARSMAESLLHETQAAMVSVAAQMAL